MRRLMLLVALVAVAACNGSDSLSPSDVAGAYALKTFDGKALPFTVTSEGQDFLLTTDVITMKSDHSWTESTHFTWTEGGQAMSEDIPDAGTWTLVGSTLTLHSPGVGDEVPYDYTGTYSKNTMTLTVDGPIQVFVR